MKWLVVGCGSIAKRHTKNLISTGVAKEDISLFDLKLARVNELTELYDLPAKNGYTQLDEAIRGSQANAAMVCCPTAFHTTTALTLASAGIHLFMEKPLAADETDLDKLISLVSDKQLVLMVGYFFRFHPGYRLVQDLLAKNAIGKVLSARVECGQYLPDWHPWEDYRSFYMSKKAEGGGALLDISHEFDYLTSLIPSKVSEVTGFYGTVGSLEMDADNLSSTLLRFENNVIASVHLDLLQRVVRRNCELIGELGTIVWDHPSKTVTVYTPENKTGTQHSYTYDGNQAYIDELNHFTECIVQKKRPLVDGVSALNTLKIVLSARKASDQKCTVRL